MRPGPHVLYVLLYAYQPRPFGTDRVPWLSPQVATALLAAMLVHIGRQCFRGNGLGKQPPREPPSGGRLRVHLGEDSTPRRRC